MADRTETERRPGTGENGAFAAGNGAPNGPQPLPKAKMPGYFEGETITRRALFTGGALAAGGIATAAIVLPAIGFALGPVFEEEDFPWQSVGPPSDFSADNYTPVTFTLDQRRTRGEAGKSIAYVRKRNPMPSTAELPGRVHRDLDALRPPRLPRALGQRRAAVRMPVSRRRVQRAGEVEGGPPVRPLDRFHTRVEKGQVQLGPRFSVNSELKRFSARDPGEPLDGLWQYLYPKRFTVPSP